MLAVWSIFCLPSSAMNNIHEARCKPMCRNVKLHWKIPPSLPSYPTLLPFLATHPTLPLCKRYSSKLKVPPKSLPVPKRQVSSDNEICMLYFKLHHRSAIKPQPFHNTQDYSTSSNINFCVLNLLPGHSPLKAQNLSNLNVIPRRSTYLESQMPRSVCQLVQTQLALHLQCTLHQPLAYTLQRRRP